MTTRSMTTTRENPIHEDDEDLQKKSKNVILAPLAKLWVHFRTFSLLLLQPSNNDAPSPLSRMRAKSTKNAARPTDPFTWSQPATTERDDAAPPRRQEPLLPFPSLQRQTGTGTGTGTDRPPPFCPFPLCNGRRTDTGKRSPLCSGRWDGGRSSSGRHTTYFFLYLWAPTSGAASPSANPSPPPKEGRHRPV